MHQPEPTRRAEDRQAEIVAKAAELLDQKGYHRATMDDIADSIRRQGHRLSLLPGEDHILFAIHDRSSSS